MFKSIIQKKFLLHLNQKKLRITGRRKIILDTFLESGNHISVEELYHKARKSDPALGLATVYRMIKLMCDAGIAVRVDFGDGIYRYEPLDEGHTHQHMICEVCHKNIEIDDHDLLGSLESLAGKYNYTFRQHKLYIYGLCSECQTNKKNS